MSAHAYAPAGAPQPDPERQPRLFALPGGAAADSPQRPLARPALAVAPAPLGEARADRTLDAELRLAWTALTAGSPAACLMCDGRIEPHGYGLTGGACTSCGTTLD